MNDETDLSYTLLSYARCIGKQIQCIQQIYCPYCLTLKLEHKQMRQPLCAVGDFEEELFCPHCDLTVCLSVTIRE